MEYTIEGKLAQTVRLELKEGKPAGRAEVH